MFFACGFGRRIWTMEGGYEEMSYGESSYYVWKDILHVIHAGVQQFPICGDIEIDLKFDNLLKIEEKVLQSIVWEIEGRIISYRLFQQDTGKHCCQPKLGAFSKNSSLQSVDLV